MTLLHDGPRPRKPRPQSAALLLCLLALTTAQAKPSAEKKGAWLPPGAINVIALLPPPPARNSAEAKAELEVVVRTQGTRTSAEIQRAKAEKKVTIAAFTSAVGPWFTAENLPQTAALLHDLLDEAKPFIEEGKTHFNRPRPALANKRLTPLLEEKHGSYPSGHSTRGTLLAIVLAQLLPEHKEQLAARGQEIGWDRIIAGVHYPSDIYAGRTLGQALAQVVIKSTAFQSRLAAVRAELNAAGHRQNAPAAVTK